MKSRVEARFYGVVQGVYFRAYTANFAKQKNITGWVCNLDDGSVSAVFEGEREDIEEVIRLLKEEHPAARIENIDLKWLDFIGQFDDFEVRY
ncbi:MAG: acylphosphatase [Euryarchaeota archaeon]|nr:acylphosphatase [Euryarchaeota archaeon]